MDSILSFLADNYKYFMIAAVVLLFALIGFIVDGKKKKKSEEVVPVPNADAQAQAAAQVAPTTPTPAAPVTPAPANAEVQAEPGLVIEEPSLNNVEPASQELNIATPVQEEQGSIFGSPEMQAPASVETTAPEQVEEPTLVIEEKEEAAPEMVAPAAPTTPVEPAVAPNPEMTPAAPVVEPTVQEVAPVAPTMTAPEVPTAPVEATTTQTNQVQ